MSRRDTIGPESTSARGTTGQGSVTESVSSRASAERDASLEVQVTLGDKEPHDHLLKEQEGHHQFEER